VINVAQTSVVVAISNVGGGTTSNPGNAIMGDPMLEATLQLSGGLTATHRPLTGSNAIGVGHQATCDGAPVSAIDQRGRPRNASLCWLGAYEDVPVPPDMTVLPDLTVLPDMTAPPDMTALPDLSTLPDMALPPDMTATAPDMTGIAIDLGESPDLGEAPDLATGGTPGGCSCETAQGQHGARAPHALAFSLIVLGLLRRRKARG
jgi:MYXO-CTERM domain-containing protein